MLAGSIAIFQKAVFALEAAFLVFVHWFFFERALLQL